MTQAPKNLELCEAGAREHSPARLHFDLGAIGRGLGPYASVSEHDRRLALERSLRRS